MRESSCQQVCQPLSDLLAGTIESADAEVLDAHLAQCTACQAKARACFRLHRALGELVAQSRSGEMEAGLREALTELVQGGAASGGSPGRQPDPLPRTRHWRTTLRGGWWVAGAAAGLLLALGVVSWIWRSSSTAPVVIARLEEMQGEVYVITADGKVLAQSHQELRSGQGLQTVGEESAAVIVYPDAPRLELGPDSLIGELSDQAEPSGIAGKHVSLIQGFVSADLTKQSEGLPMVLVTPQAEVVIHGTKISLVNSPQATRIERNKEEEKGVVHIMRRSDRQTVELTAGAYSIVRTAADPMEPEPLPIRLSQPRSRLSVGATRVLALAFTPDGQTLAAGSNDGKVRFWNMAPGKDQTPLTLDAHPQEEVRALAYSRDGRLLATGGDRPTAKVWDSSSQEAIASLASHRSWIEALAFSADGRTLVVAGAHGTDSDKVVLWDLETRQVRQRLQAHAGGVWGVAVSPDGRTLFTAGRDRTAKVWDFATGPLRHTLQGHTGEVLALALSPDGKTVATGSRDKTVRLWDTATGHERHVLLGHAHDVRSLAFAPDGASLVSGSADGTVKVWGVTDGRERATLLGQGGIVWAVAFAPDGKTLAVGGAFKTVKLWDMTSDAIAGLNRGELLPADGPRNPPALAGLFRPIQRTHGPH